MRTREAREAREGSARASVVELRRARPLLFARSHLPSAPAHLQPRTHLSPPTPALITRLARATLFDSSLTRARTPARRSRASTTGPLPLVLDLGASHILLRSLSRALTSRARAPPFTISTPHTPPLLYPQISRACPQALWTLVIAR